MRKIWPSEDNCSKLVRNSHNTSPCAKFAPAHAWCEFSSVLLDNGSALHVCLLVTAIALGFSPADFRASTHTVRAYDGTQRTVMGTITIHVMIGLIRYLVFSRF